MLVPMDDPSSRFTWTDDDVLHLRIEKRPRWWRRALLRVVAALAPILSACGDDAAVTKGEMIQAYAEASCHWAFRVCGDSPATEAECVNLIAGWNCIDGDCGEVMPPLQVAAWERCVAAFDAQPCDATPAACEGL